MLLISVREFPEEIIREIEHACSTRVKYIEHSPDGLFGSDSKGAGAVKTRIVGSLKNKILNVIKRWE